jgi:hypothetical protein
VSRQHFRLATQMTECSSLRHSVTALRRSLILQVRIGPEGCGGRGNLQHGYPIWSETRSEIGPQSRLRRRPRCPISAPILRWVSIDIEQLQQDDFKLLRGGHDLSSVDALGPVWPWGVKASVQILITLARDVALGYARMGKGG